MVSYCINGASIRKDSATWQDTLAAAYSRRSICLCECRPAPNSPTMYISLIGNIYILKRMPLKAATHSVDCNHYEAPAELSGIAQVNGSAIKIDTNTDTTTLTLGFPLTKGKTRTASTSEPTEDHSVRSDGTKLTLRATLHYLYETANLHSWVPKMAGKRSWYIVRRELMNAALKMCAKGHALDDLLFIPESYSPTHKVEIESRTEHRLSRLNESNDNRMMIIDDIKALEPAKFGYKLTLNHFAHRPLFLNDDIYKRLIKSFASQLELWGQAETHHLLLIGTFYKSPSGVLSLDRVCLVNVNDQWIPFDSLSERSLLDTLHLSSRRFIRSLRYNLKSTELIATATLQDTGDTPTALYIIDSATEASYATASTSLMQDHQIHAWAWHLYQGAMPPLPANQPYRHSVLDRKD